MPASAGRSTSRDCAADASLSSLLLCRPAKPPGSALAQQLLDFLLAGT